MELFKFVWMYFKRINEKRREKKELCRSARRDTRIVCSVLCVLIMSAQYCMRAPKTPATSLVHVIYTFECGRVYHIYLGEYGNCMRAVLLESKSPRIYTQLDINRCYITLGVFVNKWKNPSTTAIGVPAALTSINKYKFARLNSQSSAAFISARYVPSYSVLECLNDTMELNKQ